MFPVTVNIYDRLGIGTFFRITDIGSLVSGFLAAALIFSSLAFIIYFAWGALSWLTAGGDKAQVETARQRISNALIGLTLVAAAWAIYLLVIYVLGLGGAVGTTNSVVGGPVLGNANCPCSAALGGGCATTGTLAIGPGGSCYSCTSTGWVSDSGSCSAISCSTCP
ncbi:MAG: hypothetical protein A2785_03740 [Candidatus Chisholmbacteria bacterium RIFCSPHIGHO2_01_FULL_49_18]|uniref:Uncharacterized protein n=2 Tax=Candidatus Chisholmiibacteriota TaxID=1817900 RepID=A0A1G1VN70_9BACT|nr:MAG: hypothetical protein A2785_03740 [Candidatus Chisholmbacteria bacterium RIFCSPHIGHO2_01_FULL_49_18]OGY19456.1 MAG: hypothetical protein A3A65_06120 [Candidatus Chisholmbacteria bacterium RIFCSPLOWO2_01_FULL_49_14]